MSKKVIYIFITLLCLTLSIPCIAKSNNKTTTEDQEDELRSILGLKDKNAKTKQTKKKKEETKQEETKEIREVKKEEEITYIDELTIYQISPERNGQRLSKDALFQYMMIKMPIVTFSINKKVITAKRDIPNSTSYKLSMVKDKNGQETWTVLNIELSEEPIEVEYKERKEKELLKFLKTFYYTSLDNIIKLIELNPDLEYDFRSKEASSALKLDTSKDIREQLNSVLKDYDKKFRFQYYGHYFYIIASDEPLTYEEKSYVVRK